jgi:hypothetical protein
MIKVKSIDHPDGLPIQATITLIQAGKFNVQKVQTITYSQDIEKKEAQQWSEMFSGFFSDKRKIALEKVSTGAQGKQPYDEPGKMVELEAILTKAGKVDKIPEFRKRTKQLREIDDFLDEVFESSKVSLEIYYGGLNKLKNGNKS